MILVFADYKWNMLRIGTYVHGPSFDFVSTASEETNQVQHVVSSSDDLG